MFARGINGVKFGSKDSKSRCMHVFGNDPNNLNDNSHIYTFDSCRLHAVYQLKNQALATVAKSMLMGGILNPLAGKFSEDTRKKGKGTKTGASHNWRSFYLSQYDWLNGSHMTKVVWLPNETYNSYCEFVASNTPYSFTHKSFRIWPLWLTRSANPVCRSRWLYIHFVICSYF